MKALLRAKANPSCSTTMATPPSSAEYKGHTATAELLRQQPRRRRLPPPRLPRHRTLASLQRVLPPRCPSRSSSLPSERAAEGGQVAAQGRGGRRARLCYRCRGRPTTSSCCWPPWPRPPGDGEGAAEARRERRPAEQLRHAHECCVLRPPPSCCSALGQPRPAGQKGRTALMGPLSMGTRVRKALLRAKANTELLDGNGRTALQWAEDQGQRPSRSPAARSATAACSCGGTTSNAGGAGGADGCGDGGAAGRGGGRGGQGAGASKKSKKKKKAGAAAAGRAERGARSRHPFRPPPTQVRHVGGSAAEAALRAAIAGGGLSALEARSRRRHASAGGWRGRGGAARRDRLLGAAGVRARGGSRRRPAARLAAAERGGGDSAEAARVAAVRGACGHRVGGGSAAATAKADALERRRPAVAASGQSARRRRARQPRFPTTSSARSRPRS